MKYFVYWLMIRIKISNSFKKEIKVSIEYFCILFNLFVGKCPPGWTLNADRCYRYMGAALPYAQAGQFCRVSL